VNEPLRTTLADAVNLLQAEKVRYALIGGLAVSLRGRPRVTVDVDMVIAADVPRALALAAALDGTSFRPLFDDVSEVVQKAFILPLRHRATGVKVDMAVGLSGFEQQAIARAEYLDIAGTHVSVATAEDLVIMKLLAGRPRDEEDLRGLVIAQGGQMDWDYCHDLAAKLGEAVGQDLVGRLGTFRHGGRLDS
jgi:predicted nucleotidyltransferase